MTKKLFPIPSNIVAKHRRGYARIQGLSPPKARNRHPIGHPRRYLFTNAVGFVAHHQIPTLIGKGILVKTRTVQKCTDQYSGAHSVEIFDKICIKSLNPCKRSHAGRNHFWVVEIGTGTRTDNLWKSIPIGHTEYGAQIAWITDVVQY